MSRSTRWACWQTCATWYRRRGGSAGVQVGCSATGSAGPGAGARTGTATSPSRWTTPVDGSGVAMVGPVAVPGTTCRRTWLRSVGESRDRPRRPLLAPDLPAVRHAETGGDVALRIPDLPVVPGLREGVPMSELPPPTTPSVPNPGVAENGRRAAGGWVRLGGHPQHMCQPPRHRDPVERPPGLLVPPQNAAGPVASLWRCPCGRLWQVVKKCPACRGGGHGYPPRGMCSPGTDWAPATWWQRLRNRRRP